MPSTDAPKGTSAGSSTRNRTLRLALAMRGGVSLAVWIGGAVAEIDLFRRACAGEVDPRENESRQERAEAYRQLFAKTSYGHVEIDILAGASAGGLNAILYGLSQSCTSVMDEVVRDTWIKQGGIWELLRDEKTLKSVSSGTTSTAVWARFLKLFPDRRVPSILQGDDRLFCVARDALSLLAGRPPRQPGVEAPLPYTPAKKSDEQLTISVELAATLLDDSYQPGAGNRAGFSFRKTAGTLTSRFSTIPDRDQAKCADGDEALNRMALAARSTSSFPGAFEPANVNSVSVAAQDTSDTPDVPDGTGTGVAVNMAGVFPHARVRPTATVPPTPATSEPYGVVDGGIFDNIPIDRAIRAIRRAPSSQPSERRLIYVDPEPPAAPSIGNALPDRTTATSWVPVIRSSLALKQRDEAAVDELDLVRHHNDDVLLRRGRLEILAAIFRRTPPPTTSDEEEFLSDDSSLIPPSIAVTDHAYRQNRIALDAERIATLLTDPRAELCQPPRLALDFVPLPNTYAIMIKNQLAKAYNEPSFTWELPRDIYAQLDSVRVLIGWTHELERLTEGLRHHGSPIATTELSGQLKVIKGRLYRYVAVLVEAKHLCVDAILADPLRPSHPLHHPENYDLRPLLKESYAAQESLCLPDAVIACLQSRQTQTQFYEALGQWLDQPGTGKPFLRAIRDGLQALREELNDVALGTVEATASRHPYESKTQGWRESVYCQFYRSDFQHVPLVELTKLFSVTGTPASSVIAFELINSAAKPRIDIPHLRRGVQAQYLLKWLARTPTQEEVDRILTDRQALEGPDAKLAGNALFRFGGFFSARWRENDWQWGRLDAAAGIGELLHKLAQPPDPTVDIDHRIECLQSSILEESRLTTNTPPDQPALAETVGAETFDVITPHYRFALASRAVPLVLRALLPPRESASLPTILRHIAIFVARPLSIPVTLAADPLRLVLAVVVIVTSAGLLGAEALGLCWRNTFAVVLIGAGLFIGFRTFKTRRQWDQLRARLPEQAALNEVDDPDGMLSSWRTLFDSAHPIGWIRASAVLAVIVVAFGALRLLAPHCSWLPQILDENLPIEAVVLVLGVVIGFQHWFNARSHHIRPERTAVDRKAGVAQSFAALRDVAVNALKFRSPQQSRAIRVGLSVVAVAIAVAGYYISIGEADTDIAITPEENLAAPDALQGTLTAALTVSALCLISLWGWARNLKAVEIAIVGGAVGGVAQYVLDWAGPGTDFLAVYDLLPVLVWVLFLGALVQFVPHRQDDPEKKFAPHASFGEKDRPVVTPKYRDLPTSGSDEPDDQFAAPSASTQRAQM